MNVSVDEPGHDELAIESVHEPAVAGYGVAKVFYFKRALKTAGKKAAERSNGRRERSQRQRVKLKRIQANFEPTIEQLILAEFINTQRFAIVHIDRLAFFVVLQWTNQTFKLTQIAGEQERERDGRHGAAYKTLPGFFRRQLYKSCAAEEKAEHVGHNVVANDERIGQQKPNQALEHIEYHQIRHGHDEYEAEMCVAEQGELFEIVGFFQRQHERYKTGRVERERNETMIHNERLQEHVTP